MNELPNTVADESEFWRRQRELIHGRIEPVEPVRRRRMWWLLAIPLSGVILIAIARGM